MLRFDSLGCLSKTEIGTRSSCSHPNKPVAPAEGHSEEMSGLNEAERFHNNKEDIQCRANKAFARVGVPNSDQIPLCMDLVKFDRWSIMGDE